MDQELEIFAFQAEDSQFINSTINAFYSNNEIFSRQLVSNASHA